jgi:hypothetical protein
LSQIFQSIKPASLQFLLFDQKFQIVVNPPP